VEGFVVIIMALWCREVAASYGKKVIANFPSILFFCQPKRDVEQGDICTFYLDKQSKKCAVMIYYK